METLKVVQLQLSIGPLPRLNSRKILQLFSHVLDCKEIITHRLVYLQVTDVDLNISASGFALVEDVAQSSGNKPSIFVAAGSSGHGKSFSRTSLPISENSAIETLQSGVDNIFGDLVEDLFLSSLHPESLVELEHPFLLFVVDMTLLLVLRDEEGSPPLLLVHTWVAIEILKPL